MDKNVFDGSVAQLVPQQVEKLPLYHWKPGSRLLCVSSRDGAAFDDNVAAAEANTYRRPLTVELLQTSCDKLACSGMCAALSNSLSFPENINMMLAAEAEHLVLSSAGFGDSAVLQTLAPHLDALVYLLGPEPGPLHDALLSLDCHIEVLLGVDETVASLDLPWSRISALHICGLRGASAPQQRQDWYTAVRTQVGERLPVYDEDHQHSTCACGEVLIWRQAGRSRIDALDPGRHACRNCQRPVTVTV